VRTLQPVPEQGDTIGECVVRDVLYEQRPVEGGMRAAVVVLEHACGNGYHLSPNTVRQHQRRGTSPPCFACRHPRP
jgi:hypothetical protein